MFISAVLVTVFISLIIIIAYRALTHGSLLFVLSTVHEAFQHFVCFWQCEAVTVAAEVTGF